MLVKDLGSDQMDDFIAQKVDGRHADQANAQTLETHSLKNLCSKQQV